MLVPLSWLKDYVKINIPLEKLTERLTEIGLAVEKVHRNGDDVILELEITPNRPDCLSILGIAREIAAIAGGKVKIPAADLPKATKNLPLEIKNDYSLCPRYTAVIIDGVTVKPSPVWLQEKLKKVGLRPINNLVDITNYVMFETGNPLHAFDYEEINPKKMVMQQATGEEKFESVDELSYVLPKGAIIIKDKPNRVIDLCGIKGGLNSGISPKTKTVFLHVPIYNPVLIRRASQALTLQSEASAIYERGANAGGTLQALTRTASLILELAGGKIASKIFDLKQEKFTPWQIILRHQRLEKVLGIKVKINEVKKILESLELKTQIGAGATYEVLVPTHRGDLKIEEDLIEEVARIYGYNKFPKTFPSGETPTQTIPYFADYSLSEKVKQILAGAGYTEVATYSLLSEDSLRKIGFQPETVLKITNPISREFEYLRPSLVSNLLSAILLNRPNFEKIKIFELGKVYFQKGNKWEEKIRLAGVSTEEFYKVKGVVELIFEELGISGVSFKPHVKKDILFHSTRTAIMETGKEVLGTIGEINPQKAVVFDLDFEILTKLAKTVKAYQPIPLYPPIIEDLSFIIPEKTSVGDILQSIESTSSIIKSVELKDSYKDTRTFHLIYQHPQKTLTDKEVGKIREKIIRLVEQKFGARIKA